MFSLKIQEKQSKSCQPEKDNQIERTRRRSPDTFAHVSSSHTQWACVVQTCCMTLNVWSSCLHLQVLVTQTYVNRLDLRSAGFYATSPAWILLYLLVIASGEKLSIKIKRNLLDSFYWSWCFLNMNTAKELKEKMKLFLKLKLPYPFRFKPHEKTRKAGFYLDLCVYCFECIQKFKECFPLVQNYEEQLCVSAYFIDIYTHTNNISNNIIYWYIYI